MKLILAAVAALGLSGPAFAQAGHDMPRCLAWTVPPPRPAPRARA